MEDIDPKAGDLLLSALTAGGAALNGVYVILARLIDKGILDRSDLELISNGIQNALISKTTSQNPLVEAMVEQHDTFISGLVALLARR